MECQRKSGKQTAAQRFSSTNLATVSPCETESGKHLAHWTHKRFPCKRLYKLAADIAAGKSLNSRDLIRFLLCET